GDGFVLNRLGHRLHDHVARFSPTHVLQHHHPTEDEAAGIDHVFARVLGRGAVGGFKQGHAVANVAAGGHAQPADLSGGRIAHVVAVQVEGGDDVVIGRAGEQLLQHVVGNHVV